METSQFVPFPRGVRFRTARQNQSGRWISSGTAGLEPVQDPARPHGSAPLPIGAMVVARACFQRFRTHVRVAVFGFPLVVEMYFLLFVFIVLHGNEGRIGKTA
jgi:hypothetical protein